MKTEMLSEKNFTTLFKLFWIYVICGVAGYFIETVWCWIDFQEFSSRTSNLFFPISCVWGLGGVLLYLLTQRNRWQQNFYIFIKCTVIGTVFEFLCGYLGECLFQVTFWDYSGMPLHTRKVHKCSVLPDLGITGSRVGEKNLSCHQSEAGEAFKKQLPVYAADVFEFYDLHTGGDGRGAASDARKAGRKKKQQPDRGCSGLLLYG